MNFAEPANMSIERQFIGFTFRARCDALIRHSLGKDHLYDIRSFEVLERDQEYELAKRWRGQGDGDAAHRLGTNHLPLIAKIALGYRGHGHATSEFCSQ